ncbi:MAG: TolC family protein [Planctomycetota bacterium]|jgi:cobalt-zinc-cadmium efflux system outer membrane protein
MRYLKNEHRHPLNGPSRWMPPVSALALASLVGGCATVDPGPDYDRAGELIERSTGIRDVHNPQEPGPTVDELEGHLADGLALGEAVEIALLNNRQLQAAFLEIGIARADLVQSGLLANPSLGIAVLFPLGSGQTDLQAYLAQSIVELWQMPVKKRVAGHELEAKILHVARLAGELTAETKRAYYHAVATRELLTLAEENEGYLLQSYETLRVFREAGVASALDELLQLREAQQGRLSVREARLATANARRELARLLSLEADVDDLELTDPLPEPLSPAFDADVLIALARSERLDLHALSQSVLSGEANVEFQHARVFPDVSLGVGGEREQNAVGPTVNLTLPIFDQNQAQIAKAEYAQLQSVRSYEDLYLSIAQDIRIAVDRAITRWGDFGLYRDELLPQSETNLELTETAYTAGTAGILTLLESQRALIDARREYVVAWGDAARSLSDLERAVGLPLDRIEAVGEGRPGPSKPQTQ